MRAALKPVVECESLTVLHRYQEGELFVPSAQTDQLHVSIAGVADVILHSLARQVECGVGDLHCHEKFRLTLARTLAGLGSGRPGDVGTRYAKRGNVITAFISLDGGWSVSQRLELTWLGRRGADLTMVQCLATLDVPNDQRAICAAWFSRARMRLCNHYSKLLPDPTKTPPFVCRDQLPNGTSQ